MIKDMGNVGRHTWISVDRGKSHGKCCIGTPCISVDNNKTLGRCW